VPEVVVELGDVRAGDLGDAEPAEGREDEASQVAPVLIGRAGLDADGDVLPVEPLGELLDRDGAAAGVALGSGILARPCGGDNGNRTVAGLLTREDGARPQADPPRSPAGPVLDDVALAATGQDAESQPVDVVVPDEVLGPSDLGGVDQAFGQFRHRRAAPSNKWPCFQNSRPAARGSTMEARGGEPRREPAKSRVPSVALEVN
jgi:hypothetical protein